MSEQELRERAERAEASLAALKEKVVPLVQKTKELEKDAKKWKQMYEMAEGLPGTPVKGGTLRKNPSAQAKYTLDDGSELTGEHLDSLRRAVASGKTEIELLKLQNDFLRGCMRKVSLTQYMSKELMEQNVDNMPRAMLELKHFIERINEELDVQLASGDADETALRQERITTLKRENTQLIEALESERESKKNYKKELRTTKKMAKQALKRVAQLEDELKEDKTAATKLQTDLKVQIHTLQSQLAERGPAEEKGSTSRGGSRIQKRVQEGETRSRAGSVSKHSEVMSGVSHMEDREIEGGVGQKVVQLKEKKAASYKKEVGRYSTLKDLAGGIMKTATGLTVIDTNKKVEKIVAHETNVAKIHVMEARNLKPKKMPKHGFEVWYKLEMGSATFQSTGKSVTADTEGVPWKQEYAYVISTGLQSKPFMPLTVYYRPLGKNGLSTEGDGKELGTIEIPLTTFLPLIGSEESVSQWMTITEKDTKEVRGIMQVVLRVDSNVSRSERMLPKEEGFAKSLLADNITATMARGSKIMDESAPIEELVNLDPLQQAASKANPDLLSICSQIHQGAQVDPEWKNFRRQGWLHLAAMAGNVVLVKQLTEAVSSDLKVVDSTDKAGFSPWMYATMMGHLEVLQFLRHVKGLNTTRTDWNGNFPLHLACMFGHDHLIDFLVKECHNSVDDQDENAATPLLHATFVGNKACVERLCALQAMVNAEDRDGNSPLLVALIRNHQEIAVFLKDAKAADIGSYNARGDTCLWATIQTSNEEMMNVLLKDQRTDLSRKHGFYDFTLLMRCLLQLDHALCDKIVGVILSQKPNVNVTNKQGQTALYFAIAMDRPNLVTLLIMAGALVKFKDKSGNTPLHFANNEQICKTLIAHGAGQQVNLGNAQGNTPLHCSFAFGGPAVADILLSAGGDMTKKNNDGLTPADCVLVDTKYIALPFYEEDQHTEHTIFIGKHLSKGPSRANAPPPAEDEFNEYF